MNRLEHGYSAMRRLVMICRTMRLDVETSMAKTIMAPPKNTDRGAVLPNTEFIRGGAFGH